MIKNLYILALSLIAIAIHADNQQGIAYYKAGEPTIASQLFNKQLNASPAEQAEAFYYLGEIAFDAGKTSDALAYYQKGWSASSDYAYNKVGEGKVLLKTDKPAAQKAFDTAIKINKKDVPVYVAIAKAYSTNGMKPEAQDALDNAKKYNINDPAIYLYEGDLLISQDKPGDAAGRYEQAIHFDPSCKEAYLKYANVYQGVQAALSIEMLQKVITNYPDYLPAYNQLGNIYSLQGAYSKAVAAYKTYMAGGLYSIDNLIHYASALFFNKQYAEAAKVINEGQAIDPDNFLLKRLSIYNSYETNAYEKGLEEINTFFNDPDAKYIWQDYLYYGRLLNKAQQYDKATEALQKVIKENPSHTEVYKDLAEVYSNSENDSDAINAYTLYIESLGKESEAADYYQLGKYYYSAAAKDSLTATDYLTKADSLFAIVKERVPDSHLGSLWQARTQSQLDPETEQGLAKPYYETCIPILENNKDKYRNELTECYRYLGYYYYLKQDMDSSKLYWNKILSIDPANATAQEALKNIK